MSLPLRVLMIEDNEDDAVLQGEVLRDAGWDVQWERRQTADGMRAALQQHWDLVLCDYSMPGFSAEAALRVLRKSGQDIPFVVISGSIGEEQAIALMHAGASDFFLKHNLVRFPAAVERELKEAQNRRLKREAEEQVRRQAEELAAKNEELSARNAELEAMNAQLDEKARQLNRSNADLERFAFIASHDLKEPLRSVASYSQLLMRRHEQGQLDSSDAIEFVNHIREGVERMEQMISVILEYSRI